MVRKVDDNAENMFDQKFERMLLLATVSRLIDDVTDLKERVDELEELVGMDDDDDDQDEDEEDEDEEVGSQSGKLTDEDQRKIAMFTRKIIARFGDEGEIRWSAEHCDGKKFISIAMSDNVEEAILGNKGE